MTRRGFTLIELMVIIAIFGTLVSLSTYGYQRSLANSRDNQRRSDLSSIQNALEQFYLDRRTYPNVSNNNGASPIARIQLENVFGCGFTNKTYLAPQYLPAIPEDPNYKFIPGVDPTRCQATDLKGQYLYMQKDVNDPKKGYVLAALVEQDRNRVGREMLPPGLTAPSTTQFCIDSNSTDPSCTHNYFILNR